MINLNSFLQNPQTSKVNKFICEIKSRMQTWNSWLIYHQVRTVNTQSLLRGWCVWRREYWKISKINATKPKMHVIVLHKITFANISVVFLPSLCSLFAFYRYIPLVCAFDVNRKIRILTRFVSRKDLRNSIS